MMMNKPFNIIIAGGKTGGHLFPGIAVAQAIERMMKHVEGTAEILFVGTSTPFETQTLKKYGFAHKSILSKPVKGGNLFHKTASMGLIFISLIQALIILKNFKPDFVLGVGGFSSFAVVLSAWILKIPTAIQEQNSVPGLTNRLLSRIAGTIFTSFKETRGFIGSSKVKYLGNPVRKTSSTGGEEKLEIEHFDPDKFTILVTGGSQGAGSVNKAFMAAIEQMDGKKHFNIIHQTGIMDEESIQKKYKRMDIKATAKAFFHQMPQLQEIADLAIARAGAGTIFELCNKGLPAIFVPFPHAADDHQTFNAKALEDRGAAVMIRDAELTGQILKETLEDLIQNKEKLTAMAQEMQRLAMPDADEKIAACILKTQNCKE